MRAAWARWAGVGGTFSLSRRGSRFTGLGEERDPNVGLQQPAATFTIPQEPVRRRIHRIQTFNVLRGGEYFFLPSLTALSWLGKEH